MSGQGLGSSVAGTIGRCAVEPKEARSEMSPYDFGVADLNLTQTSYATKWAHQVSYGQIRPATN
jgi:hypothetical protein